MGKVQTLPPEIISKIAAGEVIERPASVVKELIENAIDAGTKTVEINLKQAGKTFIKVKDSGEGIESDDIEKIFYRHCTSKISQVSDLYRIQSLGFRGEALYSIAAISDVILRSKHRSQDNGWQIHIRGGEKLQLKPCSIPNGTEIEVRELFFNTPARRKFLKTDSTELHQILNIFLPYTLLYPQYRFSLTHHDRILMDLLPSEDRISRVCQALNLEKKNLLKAEHSLPENNISISLILGDINIQRPRRDMQFIFINNRPVYSQNINFHMNQIYKLILPQGVYPFFAVYIDLPADELDVNVHPTKREVKIKNESRLTSLLRSLCEKTLLSCGKAKQIQQIDSSAVSYNYHLKEIQPSTSITEEKETQYTFSDKQLPAEEFLSNPSEDTSLKAKLTQAHYIGSFLKKYLFFESGNVLLVVDQHAAQERITYEKLIKQIENSQIETQYMLSPLVIKLSAQEMLTWEILKDKIATIGFPTTLWDKESIALHSYPQLIKNPEISLRNLLTLEERKNLSTDILARRACRNSLMAGYEMNHEQAKYMRDELLKCKIPFSCPHGRPTIIEIPENIFTKNFLR
jgi:DNA mismatch repair protein MutL